MGEHARSILCTRHSREIAVGFELIFNLSTRRIFFLDQSTGEVVGVSGCVGVAVGDLRGSFEATENVEFMILG